ncbi:hypothetical protein PHLH8_00430 [Pseudomonas sp. Pc102]|uniref:aminopeptidase n=1 Tax=Pseudomonas sp. Pc102 TaxID=2678261 RepID=UPI001BCB6D83|nr:aminopeptidase [Pseudomonas sp. Pc102]BBP80401.1 hypothetical protein PHLH8_00430 [Pseudomonas sp. Pc102]
MPAPILLAFLDRARALAVPLLLALALNGCSSLDYYGQLASGQFQLLRAREPVAQVLADPARDAALRQRLALSQRARDFASAELALPDNGSYRVYADIHRPFVVWNVFATPALSLAPITHCFPIAGCVAYRGYYQPGRARGAAALMREQGLDTWIGGVEAYSTLGWFDDPILSSMARWDDDRLAAVIFHELAHQKLYVADDSAFNESFASFVEREGLRRWRASQGLPVGGEDGVRQREQFTALVLACRERLERLYASDLPEAQKHRAKQAEFERLRLDYRQLRDSQWQGVGRYDGWIESPLNNAKLLPFGLYDRWVPAFAELYRRSAGWADFHGRVAALAARPPVERQAALAELMAENSPVAASVE